MHEILTKKEAGEFLKVSERTVDYLVVTGQIPYARIGKRSVRFSKKRLINWVENEREGVELRYNVGGAGGDSD